MQPHALSHLADAARALIHGESILIAGSSAFLATFPHLGDPGQPLEASYDADLLVEPYDAEIGKLLHESIGENSVFHGRTGYYADVLLPAAKEMFPAGWDKRLVAWPGCEAAHCLDPHDLAAVKLQVGRPKDLALCAALLADGKLSVETIRERLAATPLTERMTVLAEERLRRAIAKGEAQ